MGSLLRFDKGFALSSLQSEQPPTVGTLLKAPQLKNDSHCTLTYTPVSTGSLSDAALGNVNEDGTTRGSLKLFSQGCYAVLLELVKGKRGVFNLIDFLNLPRPPGSMSRPLAYSAIANAAVAAQGNCSTNRSPFGARNKVRLALLHGSGAATILISVISGVGPIPTERPRDRRKCLRNLRASSSIGPACALCCVCAALGSSGERLTAASAPAFLSL